MAVVAVDPSSPITGGALLGDRVRMQAYAGDDGVFIRSMASRGHAGGLAATSTAAAAVLDAAGFDIVLLETVGTGQSEVEVAAAADTTVVLEAPEMGDEVQAIKAGLLEVADLVVVNKGDRPGAQRTASQLRAMLVPSVARKDAGSGPAQPKRPEVLVTTALDGEGIPELIAVLDRRRADAPAAQGRRVARAAAQVDGILAQRIRDRLADGVDAGVTGAVYEAVARHELDPYEAADRLLALLGDTVTRRRRVTVAATPARDRLLTAAFAALLTSAFVFFVAGGIVLPVSPRFARDELGATGAAFGIAIGLYSIAALAARPVVGWIADRYGRRPLLVAGRC